MTASSLSQSRRRATARPGGGRRRPRRSASCGVGGEHAQGDARMAVVEAAADPLAVAVDDVDDAAAAARAPPASRPSSERSRDARSGGRSSTHDGECDGGSGGSHSGSPAEHCEAAICPLLSGYRQGAAEERVRTVPLARRRGKTAPARRQPGSVKLAPTAQRTLAFSAGSVDRPGSRWRPRSCDSRASAALRAPRSRSGTGGGWRACTGPSPS